MIRSWVLLGVQRSRSALHRPICRPPSACTLEPSAFSLPADIHPQLGKSGHLMIFDPETMPSSGELQAVHPRLVRRPRVEYQHIIDPDPHAIVRNDLHREELERV